MAENGALTTIPRTVRRVGTIERKTVIKWCYGAKMSEFFDAPPIPTPRSSGLKPMTTVLAVAASASPNTYAAIKRIETLREGGENSFSLSPQYLRRDQAD